jgi:hypothetical protein
VNYTSAPAICHDVERGLLLLLLPPPPPPSSSSLATKASTWKIYLYANYEQIIMERC